MYVVPVAVTGLVLGVGLVVDHWLRSVDVWHPGNVGLRLRCGTSEKAVRGKYKYRGHD